jgi:putative tryptophan/tyrosine transport system substrate-binding protein
MRRREFIELFSGAMMAWPRTAQAQPAGPMRRVGVLTSYNASDPEGVAAVALVKKALEAAGWIEGRNVQFIIRWRGDDRASDDTIKEMIGLAPDVILAATTRLVRPLQRQTSSIPIVFTGASDPIIQGIVPSLARPGGNITGFSNSPFSLLGKSIQMLKEVAPQVERIAVLITASNGATPDTFRTADGVAKSLQMEAVRLPFNDRGDLEQGIESFARESNGGMFVARDLFSEHQHEFFVELAARHQLPAIYAHRIYVDAGGLMSYGSDPMEAFRGAASYVNRILRGEKPGDLPVQEPTKFELVVNLKTARTLGLNVPLPLLAAADEVME